ncbi:signal-regulatory protein beta-1-like [Trichosurus vulpecula]|uniref:signal-regulatory protein beta-1-like n=1 Tax=Trichosurus vulpecula TaxID=9337 RepID=UPI00186B472E|nr:signal-regulatory protein beta-1-like [Trichosurus vulpecula]
MEMSSLLYLLGSSLPSLLLILFLGLSGVRGQEEIQVLQPKGPVSVAEGETVTLNCTLPWVQPPGTVIWFKGKGPQRQEIYNFKGGTYPRIKKTAPLSSTTDYSISISHITPEDSGTYYCVKFKRGTTDTELKSGGGTTLSVTAKPSLPLVSSPQKRANINQMVNMSCSSTGFFPKDITLKWFKNGTELPALWTRVFPEGDSVSYNLTSTAQVLLTASDVHSEVICEIHHHTLSSPLRGKKKLSDIIRVPPEIGVSSLLFPPDWMAATCYVLKFYPNHLNVTWLMNGIIVGGKKSTTPTENKDGTYSLDCSLMVPMSAQKEDTVFTCQVFHDSQPPINETLRASASPMHGAQTCPGSAVSAQLFVVFLLGLKVLLLLNVSIFCIYRKYKRTASGANLSFKSSSAPAPQSQLPPASRQGPGLG